MGYNLPKKYLSYSAYSLWKTNKVGFRERYYANRPGVNTKEMMFGKQIAEQLEGDDAALSHVPRYADSEKYLSAKIDEGLTVIGYLDSFCPDTFRFLEYKTGHLGKDGKTPWTDVKVAKHDQMRWYSMLIKEVYGKVHNTCTLVWLETAFVTREPTEKEILCGILPIDEWKQLILTGTQKQFKRVIIQAQRESMKVDIIKAAKEISEDYTHWQLKQSLL